MGNCTGATLQMPQHAEMTAPPCRDSSSLARAPFSTDLQIHAFVGPLAPAPVLCRLAPHCRARRVLELQPVAGATGAVA